MAGDDDKRGTLEVGKWADLIVLSTIILPSRRTTSPGSSFADARWRQGRTRGRTFCASWEATIKQPDTITGCPFRQQLSYLDYAHRHVRLPSNCVSSRDMDWGGRERHVGKGPRVVCSRRRSGGGGGNWRPLVPPTVIPLKTCATARIRRAMAIYEYLLSTRSPTYIMRACSKTSSSLRTIRGAYLMRGSMLIR